jgi:type II secretory pathway pseudopilin PulG
MKNQKNRGFSLVELLIVMIILMIVMGAIFSLITMATARSATEQAKLDMFQEAREFMDQMSRDLRQAGFPNTRNFAPGVLATPPQNDQRAASGLVMVADGELWFEGDMDGSGTVSVVHYWLDPSTANNCPCLKRSQLPKLAANPYTGQTTPAYQTEVQNVINTDIFAAFLKGQTGTPVTLPINFNANGDTIAGIDVVQATLTVQSNMVDPQTRQRPITTLTISVKLNNCSLAANAKALSCN